MIENYERVSQNFTYFSARTLFPGTLSRFLALLKNNVLYLKCRHLIKVSATQTVVTKPHASQKMFTILVNSCTWINKDYT